MTDLKAEYSIVKNNNSTNLTPNMRLVLGKIMGFTLPYDETQESFLDMISEYLPDRYDDFKELMGIMIRDDKLVNEINELNAELHNSENIIPQEFAKKWIKILDKTRAKKTEGIKSGSYPTKQTKTVIEGLKLYWNDELPIDYYDNGQEFQHDRQTWFNKLADDNGMSFSAIEKIELKYRSPSFIPKSYL